MTWHRVFMTQGGVIWDRLIDATDSTHALDIVRAEQASVMEKFRWTGRGVEVVESGPGKEKEPGKEPGKEEDNDK